MRDHLHYVGVPAWNLVKEHIKSPQLRAKQRNMVYVGALAKLFGIPFEITREVLKDTFGDKPAVIESNLLCIKLGWEHIEQNGASHELSMLEPVPDGNTGKIMAEGNTACGLGAIFGGAIVMIPLFFSASAFGFGR